MKDYMQVADTIRNQIHNGIFDDLNGRKISGGLAMTCWGADKFTAYPSDDISFGGLSFTVKGLKFRGTVKIKLAWNDTYTVEFWKKRKGAMEIVHARTEIYAMDLAEVIDQYVEQKEVA